MTRRSQAESKSVYSMRLTGDVNNVDHILSQDILTSITSKHLAMAENMLRAISKSYVTSVTIVKPRRIGKSWLRAIANGKCCSE